jgi:ABC-2 type transport system ATP-binding protein
VNSEPAIDLRNLTKHYGPMIALDNVSFTVDRGEIFGYVGANGAGKTTTIKLLTGLIKPTFGDAFICGNSVLAEPLRVKAKIGYVPESGSLFEKLSAREYLTATGHLFRLEDWLIEEQIDRWLSYFGLGDRVDQQLGVLSKGNKQKICWVAALMHDPEVLILDEPLSGLDAETIARIKEMMKELAAKGKTVFYSSHIIDVVEKVCHRIAVLHRGRLIGVGTVQDVRSHFQVPSLEDALIRLWQQQV